MELHTLASIGVWVKIKTTRNWSAGFSQGFHFGYAILTHSHIAMASFFRLEDPLSYTGTLRVDLRCVGTLAAKKTSALHPAIPTQAKRSRASVPSDSKLGELAFTCSLMSLAFAIQKCNKPNDRSTSNSARGRSASISMQDGQDESLLDKLLVWIILCDVLSLVHSRKDPVIEPLAWQH